MPLFIFLSGYFSRKKDSKDFPASIWKLLEPLIIYHVIGLSIDSIYHGTISLNSLLTPWWILWYLLCLIYWRLMIQFIPDKIINNTTLIIITTLIVNIVAGYIPFFSIFAIWKTLIFMPYFFLGYCMKDKSLFLPNKYKPICLLFIITTLVIAFFFPQFLISLTPGEPYGKILNFCIVFLISIAFINICPTSSWIAKQGRFTMQYFIYHGFILLPLFVIIRFLNLPISLLSAIIYTILVTLLLGIASYLPYFDKLTNPSTLIKKIKNEDK